MSLKLAAVEYDAEEPMVVAGFWAELLGRAVVDGVNGVHVPGDDTQVGLRFVAAAQEPAPRRLHLHLTSSSNEDQRRTVATVLRLGGSRLGTKPFPVGRYIVLKDPGGNQICVIEPDNTFLAGCGPLGEVACDGNRDTGLFWRDALGWPLVWDRDQETAIQSPLGGTKLAWGGPPVAPKSGRNPQRFHLVATDVAAEVERLVALGASVIGDQSGTVELADPDGNEFLVSPHST
jgi:predicted enzyme related to lactoylglutathione lyase